MTKENNKGFTLIELIVAIAIMAILVGVLTPTLIRYIEKSREATDIANVRTAYDDLMASVVLDGKDYADAKETVQLKQKQADWQYYDPISIAGITHHKADGDTDNWEGIPGADGKCEISLNSDGKAHFKWSGGDGSSENGKGNYSFNINEDLHSPLNESNILDYVIKTYGKNANLELDSKATKSIMVPEVKKYIKNDSLLNHGTWAYLGSPSEATKRYLFWTSVDTNVVGANKKIPVIINIPGSDSYYISETTTATRSPKGADSYVAISKTLYSGNFKNIISTSTKNKQVYNSLKDAYDAYEKLLTEGKYQDYKNTLPK